MEDKRAVGQAYGSLSLRSTGGLREVTMEGKSGDDTGGQNAGQIIVPGNWFAPPVKILFTQNIVVQ